MPLALKGRQPRKSGRQIPAGSGPQGDQDMVQGHDGKSRSRWLLVTAITLGLAGLMLPAARAQEPPPAQPGEPEKKAAEKEQGANEGEVQRLKEEITVTGTRVEGRSATDTPAPVDYIDSATIQSTGAVETGKILQLLDPSFNFST